MKVKPIIIEDEKTILKLRSLGGGNEENGKITLHPLEAAFFAKLRVIEGDPKKFLKMSGKLADKLYAVLELLRENGYIAKPSFDSDILRVYRKGFRPGEDRTFCIVKVVDGKLDKKEILDFVEFAGKLRKEAVLAFVEKEITFIKISKTTFL
ncbi:MAG: hypothetical protein QXF35_02695 [Candidatus Bilamarchaeaceae archaeon]